MSDYNYLLFLNKTDKNCGFDIFTLKILSLIKSGNFVTLDNVKNYLIAIKEIFFSGRNLLINYTPLYWINPFKVLFIILIIFFSKFKQNKTKLLLIVHDYIRPSDYGYKFNLITPYLSFIFKFFFKEAFKVLCLSNPTGIYKNYILRNEKTKILFVPSNFEKINEKYTKYKKRTNFKYINLLIFGSNQAYQKNEIELLKEYINSLSKNTNLKIRLLLLGNAREMHIPNTIALNSSIIRFPFLEKDSISKVFQNSTFSLFFHIEGIAVRSGILSASMQHGLPIMCLKGKCTEPKLENVKGICLFSRNNLKKAINYSSDLIRNPEKYAEFSNYLINYYCRNNSWKIFKEHLKVK